MLVQDGLNDEDFGNGKKSLYSEILFKTKELIYEQGLTTETISQDLFERTLSNAMASIEGPGRETLVDPTSHELPLTSMDPYIRGVARWLNQLGIETFYSCDGHNKRPARIDLKTYLTSSQMKILKAAIPSSITLRIDGKKILFCYEEGEIHSLLALAENLYKLWKNPSYIIDLEANQFKSSLIEWLNIPGASCNETQVKRRLQHKLSRLTDYTYTDRKGNLLSYVNCGEGPTILLSAHMDTVDEIIPGREIIEEGTILRSSAGILGADDRAGIAVIMETISRIHQTNFNGTIKITFTVEEEIGCCGSRNIDPQFIEDVDAAIVLDRRGTRDIVTSYANIVPFCSEEYGQKFEEAGRLAGMPDWKVTPGGISDAKVFAEMGIQSVNLSVGYQNEHRDEDLVNYNATYETVKLIEAVLHHQLIG